MWGEHRDHEHTSPKNIVNAALTLLICAPSVLWVLGTRRKCDDLSSADSLECTLYRRHPNALLHLLFFANVSLGFWVVGLIQKSFWLIDPYWTLFPPLAILFYATRYESEDSSQLRVAALLLVVWSLRLTYSYFRRERWKFGEREDWRYTDMARKWGGHWWWMSFFAVGLAQQFMLCPLVYPFYVITARAEPWSFWDTAATFGSAIGIGISWAADGQLHEYCKTPKGKKAPVLSTGLWRYSRHPNYVGEQIWWWSLALFGLRRDWWAVSGALINSLVLAHVTTLTEDHMLSTWTRTRIKEYRKYAKVTPAWVIKFNDS